MASSKGLSAKALEALGAARLAELLIDISADDAVAKRRLRLELAGRAGSGEVAHQVRRRLATIGKARSFVEWDKVKALAADLEAQHRAIIEHVAGHDPREALDLLWRLMGLADSVLGRCDDSNGRVSAVFDSVLPDLVRFAETVKGDARALADQAFDALRDDGYGVYRGLIGLLAGALGAEGLDHLKGRFAAFAAEVPAQPPGEERRVIGWGPNGSLYADMLDRDRHTRLARAALREIAQAQGDLDGFVSHYSEDERRRPAIAADIAVRLHAAGRTEDAWQVIEGAERTRGWVPLEWEQVRCTLLEAMGRADDAQAFRWDCFARSLNAAHLRAYLKRLPDFDDVDAENRAMAHALAYPHVSVALSFLIAWPALDRASRLLIERAGELDGNDYHGLSVAAEALEQRHPLAATLAYRALIDFALTNARTKRYPHAARHLGSCAALAARIADFGPHPTHEEYHAALLLAHGRKTSFWSG